MLDADGSADPAEIPRFVEALEAGADFAKGSRFLRRRRQRRHHRPAQLGNTVLSGTANLLHGTHFTDLCYGYNAFWARCLPFISLDVPGFEVETLINLRIAGAGMKITEVPSYEADRISGQSNLKTFRDGFRVLGTILSEARRRRTISAGSPPVTLLGGRPGSRNRVGSLSGTGNSNLAPEDGVSRTANPLATVTQPTVNSVSVVVPSWSWDRRDQLARCLGGIERQTLPPSETIVVIDHNPRLLEWTRESFPGTEVIANRHQRGVVGARNTGVEVARGDVVVLTDDDTEAEPTWIERLASCFADPDVVGVTGELLPDWAGPEPAWFPSEFYWVFGCSYTGLPTEVAPVRNPIAANMAVRSRQLQ